MKTQLIKLSEKQIAEQVQYVAKYQKLLAKEIAYKDLANSENIKTYLNAIKSHTDLIENPFIEMPVFN
jgi:hypothetical protein